ncbi:hypothetical protein [Gardnerella sp. 2492-Sm]
MCGMFVNNAAALGFELPETGAAVKAFLIFAIVVVVIGIGIKVWDHFRKH